MRRRKLLRNAGLLLLPFSPRLAPSKSDEPGERYGFTYQHVEDVPEGATVVDHDDYELPARSLEELERMTDSLRDRPGEPVIVATPLEIESRPLDYSALPYSDLDGKAGYYVDVGFIMRIYADT